MTYDSPSDSSDEEPTLYEMILYGSFDEVDTLLRNGASLSLLETPVWDDLMIEFLQLDNWRDKIKGVQLLYIYHCIRQLESTNNPAVYMMELRCNVKSWVYIATMDKNLFVERLESYISRLDFLGMELYEDILQYCRTEPTHSISIPAGRATESQATSQIVSHA